MSENLLVNVDVNHDWKSNPFLLKLNSYSSQFTADKIKNISMTLQDNLLLKHDKIRQTVH